jgi:hypothetical protein
VSSSATLNTPYFANRSFKYFTISKNITDNDKVFNRLILVTDTQNQLVAVQLVNENPKHNITGSHYRGDKDYSLYNIVQNKTKAISDARVNYNVYFDKSDLLCIDSECRAPVNSKNGYELIEYDRLYLPRPIVNLVLTCLESKR